MVIAFTRQVLFVFSARGDCCRQSRSFGALVSLFSDRKADDMDSHLTDITHVIQLSVAPVFLLTAISTLIGAMNTRLGRIVDRRRVLFERNARADIAGDDLEELDQLARRRHLIYLAILFAVVAALLVCLVVAGAFLGALMAVDLARLVAGFFIFAMASMIAALALLLREIYLAVSAGAR